VADALAWRNASEIRATALHPPLQGEGRPPQAGGVGCSAPPLARAPVNAVTPPAALRASTSPSRGGGEISSPMRGAALWPEQSRIEGEGRCRFDPDSGNVCGAMIDQNIPIGCIG
jgi:hypothetical protein